MITPTLTEALGWTLLHSLWQAALVALGFYLIRQLVYQPNLAYALAVSALLTLVGWSTYTLWICMNPKKHIR